MVPRISPGVKARKAVLLVHCHGLGHGQALALVLAIAMTKDRHPLPNAIHPKRFSSKEGGPAVSSKSLLTELVEPPAYEQEPDCGKEGIDDMHLAPSTHERVRERNDSGDTHGQAQVARTLAEDPL